MIVKVLAAKLQDFEDDGLGYADVCIKNEDGLIEGIEGVDLDRRGALAVIILVRES